MRPEVTRRSTLIAAPALVAARRRSASPVRFSYPFRALERRAGGRLGVWVVISDFPTALVSRPFERFPMCSSFKFILAGCVLARADAGLEDLQALVRVPRDAVLDYAPITGPAAQAGAPLSVEALCEAAVKLSDNTAANLLLERVGGPAGFTRWMRGFDPATRLDRTEPTLNEARPGDPRDTTTPNAMIGWLERLLLDQQTLKPESSARLTRWMEQSPRGLTKLRAGVPGAWRTADKTGTNGRDTSVDVAVVTPPGGLPILIAACLTRSTLRGAEQDAIFQEIARVASQPVRDLEAARG